MERAQEDGEDDGGTLVSSTPRSKNTRSPKETSSSSEKVSDFFYGKRIHYAKLLYPLSNSCQHVPIILSLSFYILFGCYVVL